MVVCKSALGKMQHMAAILTRSDDRKRFNWFMFK